MKKQLLTTLAGFGLTLSFALLTNYSQLKTNITTPLEYNVSQKEQINVEENHFHENNCHHEEGNSPYLTYVKSYEKDTIDGLLAITVIIEAEDTSYIGNVFSFEALGHFFTGSGLFHTNRDSLMPGDTMMFHFSLSYDIDSVPYYPADLDFYVKDSINNETVNNDFSISSKIYFTPWNTIEVWNFDDFHGQNRVWLANEGNPTRVFIHKDSLPVSDITDTIPDDAFLKQIDGLAYAIPFIEPDTFNWDEPDSTDYGDPGAFSWNPCPLRKRFTASINNFRFFSWYNPPNDRLPNGDPSQVETKIWLKNATVEVHVDRWPEGKIAVLQTDNEGYIVDGNGNRNNIEIEFCAGLNRSSIDIWFEVLMHDPNNNDLLRVKMAGSTKRTHSFVTNKRPLVYSTSHPNVSNKWGVNVNVGGVSLWQELVIPQKDLGLTYTMFAWALDYTRRELHGTGQVINKNLKVRYQDSKTGGLYNQVHSTLRLGSNSMINETTIYHEFGHYVLHHLHAGWWSAGGNHSDEFNNKNTQQTMSEGVADAFAGIMDEMTWNVLGQSSDERGNHIRPFFRNNGELKKKGENARLNHPFLSEHYISSVILDLWDGTQNYTAFGNTQTGPDLGPDREDVISGSNMDNFEMSFKDIFRPFWQYPGDVNTVEDYFNFLINNAPCEKKNSIARIFQFNTGWIDGTVTNAADFPNFNMDEIGTYSTFNVTGYKIVNDDDLRQRTTEFTHNRNFPTLTGENNSYNVTRFEQIYDSDIIWYRNIGDVTLTDNLTVLDNATLQIHGNQTPRFYNNVPPSTTYNQYNEHLNVNLCQGTQLTIGNDGNLEIGSISPYRTANLYIKNGSVLDLRSWSKLLIHNGSKLIIEPGATLIIHPFSEINNNGTLIIEAGANLIIHPDAQIILNGSNAVLHINGRIILEQNADFNPIAGANGYGKVVFDNSSNGFIIDARRTNRIIIDPETKSTNLNQHNLVTIGKVVVTTENPPGISLNKPISLFEVLNANVLITDQSSLETRTVATNFNNSTILGEVNKSSIGVIATASRVTINQTRFEWLDVAFENKLRSPTGARQMITNSQFIKCKTGVKMNGGFVTVENCLFNWFGRYGDYGIQALGSSSGNLFIDNTLQLPSNPSRPNNHTSKSLEHFGKYSRVLRNVFVDGNRAINHYDGEMHLECNHFASWTFRELSYNAIASQNGKLFLNTGRNLFAHFNTYLNTNNSQLFLQNGANLFLLGQPNLSQLYFNCKLNQNQLIDLKSSDDNVNEFENRFNDLAFMANGNYWKESGNPNSTDFKPFSHSNHNMVFSNLSQTMFYDIGYLTNLSSSNYVSEQNAFCTPRYTNIHNPLTDIIETDILNNFSSEFSIPPSDPKKPSTITENNYIDLVVSTFEKANEEVVDFYEVLPEIIYIAQLRLPDTSRNVAMYIYDLSHNVYNLSLTDTTSKDSIRNSRRTYFGEMMLAAQDTLIARSYSTDSFWLSMRYELLRDKAEILRALDRRTEAIGILDSAIVDPTLSNLKKSHATTWRCFINQEQEFIDSVITIEELDFALCMPEDSIEIHTPYTTIAKDTIIEFCYFDVNNKIYEWTTIDSNLRNTFYNEDGEIIPSNSNAYILTDGKYALTSVDSINKIFYYTGILLIANENETINLVDEIQIDCEALPYQFNSNFEQVNVFENNVLMDSTTYNQYVLSPTEYVYRTEYRNSGTCQFEKRILNFTDVLQSPPTDPSAYVFAKYDR
ncbi:MAG: hypothetical protein Q8K70_02965, partial [Bacteroidota bacterium]|nr:hypothetical protein [Bacteroidota bacterium]